MRKSKMNHKKSRRFRKSRKNRTRRIYPSLKEDNQSLAKGPTDPVPCCMCDNKFPRNITMVPSICLRKHGEKAHRICQDCWWDPKTGFAREDAPHECPGCKTGQSLISPLKKKNPKPEDIIVISDD